MRERGVVLIGMPGAGKSTVGVLLAKALGLGFDDTDLLIQTACDRTLQQILDADGYLRLRELEQQVILQVAARGRVVATGGSAVYSEPGMHHLGAAADIVYLDVPLTVLLGRLDNLDSRGVARPPGQTLEDLFAERTALYRHYADVTIDANLASADAVALAITEALANR
jgi:shikimate kinase